ncbi:pyridoxamine 5'-phosphate oxidase family protein [Clostridium sp. KNHs214]|uniref:pyridoxamine 5'-phosphate oxidase family protein n=1 Tax=Clostridium sp. KNHs214 TaxID=1540257 RepID=UPI0005568C4A|nr:pyridoxamine 5'-phosphate oxidase family protein [Clostridium sp. KNHs214]
MQRTMIIYEGLKETTEKIVKKMALVLGPARYCTTEGFKEDYKNYDLFVIAAPVSGEKLNDKILKFVMENATWLINKEIGLICTDTEKDPGIKALKKLQSILGSAVVHCKTIKCDKCIGEIVQFSLELKRIRESFLKTMPKEDLKKSIDDFINSHKICDLATGYNNWIRSTPMEYIYKDGGIYILSEGGKKFANIILNNRVSISIYGKPNNEDSWEGMQIRGKAEILELGTEEYSEILKLKGIDEAKLNLMPGILNCIKINFDKIEYLSSKFKSLGYSTKQIYYYKPF